MMNAAQLQDFRRSILYVLDAAGATHGLTVDAIMLHVRRFGFCPQREETVRQIEYLAGEPLCHVALVDKQGFSPEVRNWKITTRGMNFLAEESA